MFKLSKKEKECLLKIGIGVIIIVILFRLFKNTYRNNPVIIEGVNHVPLPPESSAERGFHQHMAEVLAPTPMIYRLPSEEALSQARARLEALSKVEWRKSLDAAKGAGKVCRPGGLELQGGYDQMAYCLGGDDTTDFDKYDSAWAKRYVLPPENMMKGKQCKSVTKKECAKQCAKRGMPWMSHGALGSRPYRHGATSPKCKPEDLNCKGRCYCYKKCWNACLSKYPCAGESDSRTEPGVPTCRQKYLKRVHTCYAAPKGKPNPEFNTYLKPSEGWPAY